jgi:penicillin-binding protein 2
MAKSDSNRPEQSATLIESQKGYDLRVIFFYFLFAAGIAVLVGGLVNQQIIRNQQHAITGDRQSQRRIVIPGQRGEIYDRNGAVLATNQSRFSAVLYVDELRKELAEEMTNITKNYRKAGADLPTSDQRLRIARLTVVQRYLDQLNSLLGRTEPVVLDPKALARHFGRDLLIPFTLVDELTLDEYARLIERLPVTSPLQVYATTRRYYPYGSSAAHAIGSVQVDPDVEIEDFHDDLRTFTFPGIVGREGLEKQFNAAMEGEAGGRTILVDPHGYTLKQTLSEPLAERKPIQGKSLTTSLDIDLQMVAEEAIGDRKGIAVALDVNTGEVLVLASKPDYDLNDVSPSVTPTVFNKINEEGGWYNRAITGLYPPGSTFKILTSIAGLRSGAITPDLSIIDCDGVITIGGRKFYCDNGNGHHHLVTLADAITHSCDIYFYEAGKRISPEAIAAEGRRFGMFQKTGIELPSETNGMFIPDPAWKKRVRHESWYAGDTANMAIGQGDDLVSPLGMATLMASVARNEVTTKPTLIHNPNAPRQQSEPIGLTPEQRAALLKGMVGVTTTGTASLLGDPKSFYYVPGLRIAGKTGTAQKTVTLNGEKGTINFAWFVGFAPAENPEIAFAVMLEGEDFGELYGGANSGPIAGQILKKYFEKKNPPAAK